MDSHWHVLCKQDIQPHLNRSEDERIRAFAGREGDAQAMEKEMTMAKLVQIVVFGVGKELYGVGIEDVHEIIKVPEITAVPDAPPALEGMINLRGKILPVIDLRRRLRLTETARDKHTRVLIAESGGRSVGLLVDSVSEVLKVPLDALEPPRR